MHLTSCLNPGKPPGRVGANAVLGVGVRERVVEWMQAAGSQVEGAGMRAPRGGVLLPLFPSAEDHTPFTDGPITGYQPHGSSPTE